MTAEVASDITGDRCAMTRKSQRRPAADPAHTKTGSGFPWRCLIIRMRAPTTVLARWVCAERSP